MRRREVQLRRGAADEAQRSGREARAEDEAERAPGSSEREPLAEERREDGAARRAERAHDADVRPAAQDRDRERVVDEVHPDEESDRAERREVHAERAHEAVHGLRPALGAARRDAGRQRRRHLLENARAVRVGERLREHDVDAVEAADLSERLLRRRDVQEDDRPRRRARRAGEAQDGRDAERALDGVRDERERRAGGEMVPCRKRFGDQKGISLKMEKSFDDLRARGASCPLHLLRKSSSSLLSSPLRQTNIPSSPRPRAGRCRGPRRPRRPSRPPPPSP